MNFMDLKMGFICDEFISDFTLARSATAWKQNDSSFRLRWKQRDASPNPSEPATLSTTAPARSLPPNSAWWLQRGRNGDLMGPKATAKQETFRRRNHSHASQHKKKTQQISFGRTPNKWDSSR